MKNLVNRIQDLEKELIREEKQKIYNKQEKYFLTEMKKIGIEELPYSYSALKRFVDAETMSTHYNKHYKGYVDKLNLILSQTKFGDMELENIVKNIKKYNKAIQNNAGGAFNHALFWKMLTPKQIKAEKFEIYKKISSEFKTFTNFIKKFESVAKERFGSGWVWLVLTKNNKLKIMSTSNQENPLMNTIKDGGYPLLGLDLWEHAYYLKYKNKKDDYIKNFWKVVNWEFVDKLYQMKKQTKLNEQYYMGKLFLTENESESKYVAKTLMDLYPKLKSKYAANIRSILKSVYPENFVQGTSWFDTGIYNLESTGRSVINKFDTNYSVMGILLDKVNEFIRKKDQETEINLSGTNEKEVGQEMDRLLQYLWKYKRRIFYKDSKLFKILLDTVTTTHEIGDVNEMHAVLLLKKLFKEVNKIGKLGDEKDMTGTDVEITHNGTIFTAQIKPVNSIKQVDDDYEISINSGVKQYKTDWMIFIQDRKKLYVFPTSKTKIVGDKYVVPTKYMLFTID